MGRMWVITLRADGDLFGLIEGLLWTERLNVLED